jgi:hypothetical protein
MGRLAANFHPSLAFRASSIHLDIAPSAAFRERANRVED